MPAAVLEQEAVQNSYNLSTCCMLAEMSPACMPLCHYDARMSTMKGLAHICAPEYHKVRPAFDIRLTVTVLMFM